MKPYWKPNKKDHLVPWRLVGWWQQVDFVRSAAKKWREGDFFGFVGEIFWISLWFVCTSLWFLWFLYDFFVFLYGFFLYFFMISLDFLWFFRFLCKYTIQPGGFCEICSQEMERGEGKSCHRDKLGYIRRPDREIHQIRSECAKYKTSKYICLKRPYVERRSSGDRIK